MSGRIISQHFHDEALRALAEEGPLARMARETVAEENRRDRAALHGPLADLPNKVPQLGPVSGDGLARLLASRFATPSQLDIWSWAAERVVSTEAEAMARRMHEGQLGALISWSNAGPKRRNHWRIEAAKYLAGGEAL